MCVCMCVCACVCVYVHVQAIRTAVCRIMNQMCISIGTSPIYLISIGTSPIYLISNLSHIPFVTRHTCAPHTKPHSDCKGILLHLGMPNTQSATRGRGGDRVSPQIGQSHLRCHWRPRPLLRCQVRPLLRRRPSPVRASPCRSRNPRGCMCVRSCTVGGRPTQDLPCRGTCVFEYVPAVEPHKNQQTSDYLN